MAPQQPSMTAGQAVEQIRQGIAQAERLLQSQTVTQAERQQLQQQIQQSRDALKSYEDLLSQGNLRNAILAPVGLVSAGVVADDATGVGVLNDPLLIPLGIVALGTLALTQGPASQDALRQGYERVKQSTDGLLGTVRGIQQRQQTQPQAGSGASPPVAPTQTNQSTPQQTRQTPVAPVQTTTQPSPAELEAQRAQQRAAQEQAAQQRVDEAARVAREAEARAIQARIAATQAETRRIETETQGLRNQMARQDQASTMLANDLLSRFPPEVRQQIIREAAQAYQQAYPNEKINLDNPQPQHPSVWWTNVSIAASHFRQGATVEAPTTTPTPGQSNPQQDEQPPQRKPPRDEPPRFPGDVNDERRRNQPPIDLPQPSPLPGQPGNPNQPPGPFFPAQPGTQQGQDPNQPIQLPTNPTPLQVPGSTPERPNQTPPNQPGQPQSPSQAQPPRASGQESPSAGNEASAEQPEATPQGEAAPTSENRGTTEERLNSIRERLSDPAKAEFDRERQETGNDAAFLAKLEAQRGGDPVRRFEGIAESRGNQSALEAQRDANLQEAKQRIANSDFLERPEVQEAAQQTNNPEVLSELLTVELTDQAKAEQFPAEQGYENLEGVKLYEVVPGYSSVKEWEAANPGENAKQLVEKDGKIYRPAAEIDLLVVRNSPDGKPSEIVQIVEVKSGKEPAARARKQVEGIQETFQRIQNGEDVFVRHQGQDITGKLDIQSANRAEKITRGPEGKQGYSESVGLTVRQIQDWVREIQQSRPQQQSLVTPAQFQTAALTAQMQATQHDFRNTLAQLREVTATIPTYAADYPKTFPIQDVSANVAQRPFQELTEADKAFFMVARAQELLVNEGRTLANDQTFFHGKNYGITQSEQGLDIVRTGTYLPLVSYANGELTLHQPLNQPTDNGVVRTAQQTLLAAQNPIKPDDERPRGFER